MQKLKQRAEMKENNQEVFAFPSSWHRLALENGDCAKDAETKRQPDVKEELAGNGPSRRHI